MSYGLYDVEGESWVFEENGQPLEFASLGAAKAFKNKPTNACDDRFVIAQYGDDGEPRDPHEPLFVIGQPPRSVDNEK